MTRPAVVQFEISARDSPRLQTFYADLFGWTMHPTHTPSHSRILAGEHGIPGAIGPSWDGGPGRVTLYVEVDDLDATLRHAEALDGTVVGAPLDQRPETQPARWLAERRVFEVPAAGIYFAFVADPAGNVIGISQGLEHGLEQFTAAHEGAAS